MNSCTDPRLTANPCQIDCWDGPWNAPSVTHGHVRVRPFDLAPSARPPRNANASRSKSFSQTFCTTETFLNVAKAVADCAWLTSTLPIVLSLEV
jgi:hypothetical protein